MQTAASRMPRLAFFRLLVPRLSAPPILPITTRHKKTPSIRISTASSSRGFRTYAPLRQDSPSSSSSPESSLEGQNVPLTTKLKILIKSYGLYAIGVYLAIGIVDFSIAFAAVNFLGAEQVGKVTQYVKGAVLDVLHGTKAEDSPDANVNGRESTHGGGNEGLYAMILLAYTVHKTLFMPLRAGLVMAITPRLVRWLRTRGWTGSGGATRAATHLRGKMKKRVDNE